MKLKLRAIKILFFLLITNWVVGQTEMELKENASKLFEGEQYVEATSIYLQLLSLNPKNADYNFRYGTCLLFNSYRKQKALRYLSYAVKQKDIDVRAFYFYGKALHLNYQFKEAIQYYQKYLTQRTKKDRRYKVEREIEMCENGQKLLVTFTDIVVKNKKEIDQSKFFRLYDNMETVGGEILVSAEFQSKTDKKKGHIPILHFPQNAKAIYYASYGNNDNKDIYVRRRLPNGKWGEPQILPGLVNTSEDEDFPFMHPSGDFLFFSSKGHNSMGGYDIFMSRFDPNTNSFGKPENVDFAISSPDDDLFYVVDESFQNAYFASARQSQNGKLHVYNVRVARVPIREVIVMGDFLSEINPENKKMTVEVFSFTNGESIGKIKTNKVGKYSFVFPKGGKYHYEVKIDGSEDVYKFIVDLPFLDEFRPLKQKAIHTSVDGQEVVKIVNLFDEKVEGAEALIAEVIRKKAELDVNIDQFDLKELEAQENRDKILAEIGFEGMSMREVANQLNELALTEELKQKQIEQIIANVNNEIIEKSKLLEVYNTTIADLKTRIDEAQTPEDKHRLLNEQLRTENEKNALIAEITHLENVKNKMAMTSLSNDGKNQMAIIEAEFNQFIKNNDEESALALLVETKDKIQKTKNQSPSKIINEMIEESIALNNEIKELNQKQLLYEQNKNDLHASIVLLENSIPNAKKKEVEGIKERIAQQKEEIDLLVEMTAKNQKRIDEYNQALYVLDNNISTVQKALLSEEVITHNNTDKVDDFLDKLQPETTEITQIQNQISQLEEEYPTLSPNYEGANTDENNLAVNSFEDLKKDGLKQRELIEQSDEWNDEEKKAKIIELNETLTQEINDRLLIVNEELTKKSDNQELVEEKEKLLAFQDALNIENEKIKEELTEKETEEYVNQLEVITNNHQSKVEAIKNNEQLSEKEKNELLINANNEMMTVIDKRIVAIRSELSKNPSSKERKNEQKELNALTKQLEKQNEVLQNEISLLENENTLVDNSEEVSSETLLKTIAPDYESKKEAIANNTELSKDEKLEALSQNDQELINELQKVQKKIKKDLSKSPDNPILLAKEKTIQELIAVKSSDIEERKQLLLAMKESLSPSDEEIEARITEEITSDYLAEIKDINQKEDGFEKEKDRLIIEQAQLDRIASKTVAIQKEIKNGKNELRTELSIYEKLEKEQLQKVEEQKQKVIASITVGEIEQAILSIDEKYPADIAELNTANDQAAIVNREKELQKSIQAKIEQLEKNLKRKYSVEVEIEKAIFEIAFKESIERESEARKNSNSIVENSPSENNSDKLDTNNDVNTLVEGQSLNSEKINELNEIVVSEESITIVQKANKVNQTKNEEIEQLKLKAEQAKSNEEKAYLLEKAILKQDALNNVIATTIVEQKIQQVEQQYNIHLNSQEELERQKRTYTIRIGELTTEILRVDQEIKEAKRKEVSLLEQEKAVYIAEKELIESKLQAIDEQIVMNEKQSSFVPTQAKETTITFNEEREIASSESYKDYEEKAIKVLEIENQIRIIEKDLKEEKKLLITKISEDANSEEIKKSVDRIKELEKELEVVNIEFIQKKHIANEALPSNPDQAMKMQNLVYRGIKPLKVIAVASLLNLPSEGFTMNPSKVSSYSAERPIPMDVKHPSGLVYRVQIGAFSKPIPQDLFKEFTPVSGELIKGTKITRYMAGYFNNANAVVEARKSIRELGYSDAFIVAYCDGERIGFGEARRREANGTCVAKGQNELIVEVAQNTAEKLGLPVSNEIEKVPEYSYHDAPGAVTAEPIEMMQGLFFTVQIGVFNRPVSDEVIYNLPEILTIRLPNGQIRYNTGLFNSVKEALPRRKEALARGIVGAFVVAYYKGERIPLSKAKFLLAEKGNQILQTEIAQKEERVVETNVAKPTRTDTVTTKNLVSTEEQERVTQQRIQIVTKKEFDEFPRDVLNRYNAEGSFYYDEKDRKVKSYIYRNVDDLPRLWNFVDDIDTVYLPILKNEFDLKIISISIEGSVIPGDFMDWMLRTKFYHEITETPTGLDVRFYNIEEGEIEELQIELKTFNFQPIIIDELIEDE